MGAAVVHLPAALSKRRTPRSASQSTASSCAFFSSPALRLPKVDCLETSFDRTNNYVAGVPGGRIQLLTAADMRSSCSPEKNLPPATWPAQRITARPSAPPGRRPDPSAHRARCAVPLLTGDIAVEGMGCGGKWRGREAAVSVERGSRSKPRR